MLMRMVGRDGRIERGLFSPQGETLFLLLLGSQGPRMHSVAVILPWGITAPRPLKASAVTRGTWSDVPTP